MTFDVPLIDLQPHPRNAEIYGVEDVSVLADQIAKSDWIKPLVVNADNKRIISGHRRWLAARELGLSRVPVEYRVFASETDELEALLLENASRDKTPEQKVREAAAWVDIESEKAHERMTSGANQHSPTPNLAEGSKGETRQIVAEKVGMKKSTYEKAAKVVATADALKAEGNTEQAAALLTTLNEKSVHAAYKTIVTVERQHQREARAQALPEGIYSVIYADPAWEYSNSGINTAAARQYQTMPTSAICNLLQTLCVQPASESVLLLWATNALLTDALCVVEAWGFRYVTNRVWVKDRGIGGFHVNGRHELLLVGVRGSFLPASLLDSVITAANDVHSRKPELYSDIEAAYPRQRYIELFARNNPPRDGWTFWGDQANGAD